VRRNLERTTKKEKLGYCYETGEIIRLFPAEDIDQSGPPPVAVTEKTNDIGIKGDDL